MVANTRFLFGFISAGSYHFGSARSVNSQMGKSRIIARLKNFYFFSLASLIVRPMIDDYFLIDASPESLVVTVNISQQKEPQKIVIYYLK